MIGRFKPRFLGEVLKGRQACCDAFVLLYDKTIFVYDWIMCIFLLRGVSEAFRRMETVTFRLELKLILLSLQREFVLLTFVYESHVTDVISN